MPFAAGQRGPAAQPAHTVRGGLRVREPGSLGEMHPVTPAETGWLAGSGSAMREDNPGASVAGRQQPVLLTPPKRSRCRPPGNSWYIHPVRRDWGG